MRRLCVDVYDACVAVRQRRRQAQGIEARLRLRWGTTGWALALACLCDAVPGALLVAARLLTQH